MATRQLNVELELVVQRCEGGIWYVGDEMCATTISAGEKIAKALGLNGEITAAAAPKKRRGRKPKLAVTAMD